MREPGARPARPPPLPMDEFFCTNNKELEEIQKLRQQELLKK